MNIRTQQKIDRIFGKVLCSALTLADRVFPGQERTPGDGLPVNKVLVIKFWGLGSILIAAPGISQIKHKYPHAHVTFLTLSRNREIMGLLDICDAVEYIEIDKGIVKLAADVVSLIVRLRRQKIDLIIDLEFFTCFSAIVTYLISAPLRGGFYDWQIWRGDLHTIKVPFNRYWHTKRNFENLISRCIDSPLDCFDLWLKPAVPDEARAALCAVFSASGIDPAKEIICVNANAGELAFERRWPAAHFVELVRVLAAEGTCQIVLIGSRSEYEHVKRIHDGAGSGPVFNLAGKLSLGMLAALLGMSRLLITNDSGPLHLAAALDIPTASFFGPETPVLYAPPVNKGHIVFYNDLDCSPCINVHNGKLMKCYRGKPECLDGILVKDVIRKLKDSSLLTLHANR